MKSNAGFLLQNVRICGDDYVVAHLSYSEKPACIKKKFSKSFFVFKIKR